MGHEVRRKSRAQIKKIHRAPFALGRTPCCFGAVRHLAKDEVPLTGVDRIGRDTFLLLRAECETKKVQAGDGTGR